MIHSAATIVDGGKREIKPHLASRAHLPASLRENTSFASSSMIASRVPDYFD